jgi:DEAD/DEAH box helicase domain-containing protein
LRTELAAKNLLKPTSRGWVYAGRGRAAGAVTLDGLPSETFRIMCNGRLLETMDRSQAFHEAHVGAILLHQGESYIVKEMDLGTHTIRVMETDVDYYTQPLKEVSLVIIETLETRTINHTRCAFGEVEVTEQYTGYKVKRGDTIIGVEPLSLPPLTFRTTAFWLNLPAALEQEVIGAGLDIAGGLHGAEHALIALMPLHVMCDRWDIGGLSAMVYGESGEPVIFVYDAYEGGIGLAEKAFEILPSLFSTSRELVRDCQCEEGCPSCIYSPKCGNDNQPLDKAATVLVLKFLCGVPEGVGCAALPKEPGQAAP